MPEIPRSKTNFYIMTLTFSVVCSVIKALEIGKAWINHGLLNIWTSQLDLGITTGGLERVVSVHNST